MSLAVPLCPLVMLSWVLSTDPKSGTFSAEVELNIPIPCCGSSGSLSQYKL